MYQSSPPLSHFTTPPLSFSLFPWPRFLPHVLFKRWVRHHLYVPSTGAGVALLPSGATSPKKTDIPSLAPIASQQLLSWTWKFSWIHAGVLVGLFPCRSVYEATVTLSSWMQRPHHVQQIVFPHRLPTPDSYNLSSPLPSGEGHGYVI